MSDVKLFQTNDGGEITAKLGVVEMSGGLETMAYLALFGGNEDDSGRPGDRATWWGNVTEPRQERHYRSRFQHQLARLTPIPANLGKLEDAARTDLAIFTAQNIASDVAVSARITGLNRVALTVTIRALGETSDFTFIENWRSEAAEL